MRATNESGNLDFLRAYAVLAVYVGHLLQTFGISKVWGPFLTSDFAQTGVLIFFVHTCLVLLFSLERGGLSGWRMFSVFYIRRAFRIYPLSIATILCMLAMRAPAFPGREFVWPDWLTIASNVALTQNLVRRPAYPTVLWSLPWEIQMYVALPLLFVVARRFSQWWVSFVLWAIDVAAIALMWRLHVPARYPGILIYTPCFLAGFIAYRLGTERRFKLPFWGWPIAITCCVLLRMAARQLHVEQAVQVSAWLACLVLGLAIPHFQEIGRGWLRSIAAVIAKYSFGIYLSHSVVFWVAFVVLRNTDWWVRGAACVLLSLTVPKVMYLSIEKPLINVGIRIADLIARPKRLEQLTRLQADAASVAAD